MPNTSIDYRRNSDDKEEKKKIWTNLQWAIITLVYVLIVSVRLIRFGLQTELVKSEIFCLAITEEFFFFC